MQLPFEIERLQVEEYFNQFKDLIVSKEDKSIDEAIALLDQQLTAQSNQNYETSL